MFANTTEDEQTDYGWFFADGLVPLILRLKHVMFRTILIIICVLPFKALLLKASYHVEARGRLFCLIERKLAEDGLLRINDVAAETSLVSRAVHVCQRSPLSLPRGAPNSRSICAPACSLPKRLSASRKLKT